MVLVFQLLVVIAAVLLTAYYSGIETGLISLRRLRLEHRLRAGDPRARLADYYLENPDRLFGTTLVGTNLCTVAASVAAASLLARWFGGWGSGAAGVLMTAVLLVFGEYLPKAWFRAHPTERSLRLLGILRFSEGIFHPVGRMLTLLVRVLIPLASHAQAFARPFISRDELRLLALESEAAVRITPRERRIISAILELPCRRAAQAMTPKERMICIPAQARGEEAVEAARRTGYTRLVVRDESTDRVVGVVNVLDILRLEGEGSPVMEFVSAPNFVGADASLTEVLKKMRMLRDPLLLVGSGSRCRGVITTEDILRLVVGEGRGSTGED